VRKDEIVFDPVFPKRRQIRSKKSGLAIRRVLGIRNKTPTGSCGE
jgi:hypothetical protein